MAAIMKEFHRQWELLRTDGEIVQSEFQRVKAGPDGKINGLEVETSFDRNGQRLWQNSWRCRPGKPVLMILLSRHSEHSMKKTRRAGAR